MRHVAVAGGGIGGLTAALALAQADCRVTVFERASTLTEVGAGLQLSPNATRVLRRLGILDRVADDAVRLSSLCIGRGRDGTVLARLPLGQDAERRFGAPFLVTLRADLHRALRAGIDLHPNVKIETRRAVAGYRLHGEGLSVQFDGGRPGVQVDGLVGCDGLHSAVRELIGGGAPRGSRQHGGTAWRATVEAAAVPDRFRQPNSHLWLSQMAHLVHYPVAAGRTINIVAAIDGSEPKEGPDGLWSTPGDPAEISRRFASWAQPIRQLIAAPTHWSKWPLVDRRPLPRWSEGLVTLLGDAAHPMLPFLAQGAAQAIEDAAALADAAKHDPADLAAAFKAYEAARLPRTARVQAESRRQAVLYHLSPPASTARDLVLRFTPADRLLARYDWLYGA